MHNGLGLEVHQADEGQPTQHTSVCTRRLKWVRDLQKCIQTCPHLTHAGHPVNNSLSLSLSLSLNINSLPVVSSCAPCLSMNLQIIVLARQRKYPHLLRDDSDPSNSRYLTNIVMIKTNGRSFTKKCIYKYCPRRVFKCPFFILKGLVYYRC